MHYRTAIAAALMLDTLTAVAQPPLEEVVVTARKRAENLQDIPISVSALGSQALRNNGINNLGDMQAQVPGLTIYAARGTTSTATAYIRGVGQSDPLWGVEPGVGIYVDDVYLARPQGALLELLNVERIEVLRGPQGTLYGRNTIGGAIKYVTRKPGADREVELEAAAGSYRQRDVKASVSGPLVGNALSGSLAIGRYQRDGFGQNRRTGADVSDRNIRSVYGSLLWQADDYWALQLSADLTEDESATRGAQRMLENGFEPFFDGNPPLSVSENRFDVDNGFDIDNPRVKNSGGSLSITGNLSDRWTVKSISAYREGRSRGAIDFDNGPHPIADVDADYTDRQGSQELQFNYDNGSDLKAVVGLYFLDAIAGGEVRNRFALPGAAIGLPVPGLIIRQYGTSGGDVSTTAYAAYGDISWALDTAWTLSLGARYNSEEKTAKVQNLGFTDASFSTPNGSVDANFEDAESWHDFSPRISLDYRIGDRVLSYASISRGFKSGGFNTRANTRRVPRSAEPYDPETVVSYELGIKTQPSEQSLLNIAFFYSDYRDIQLSIFTGIDSDGDGSNDQFFGDFANAGEAVIQGVETEFRYHFSGSFTVSGNIAYLDAEYKEYLSGGRDIADQQIFTNTPQWTATLNAHWQLQLGSWGFLTSVINYGWRDTVYPTTDLSEIIHQNSYGVWNATIGLEPASARYRIALEGKNLGDEKYRTSGYDLRGSGFPIVTGYYGDPRTVTLRAEYRF